MDANKNYKTTQRMTTMRTRSQTKGGVTTTTTTKTTTTQQRSSNSNADKQQCVTDDKPTNNKTLYVVFIALTVDLIGFTIILPLLPNILDYYAVKDQGGLYLIMKDLAGRLRHFVGAPDTDKWNSILFGGFIGSLFSMLQFISSPLLGALSDVHGRRPVMLLSLIGVSFSYVLWIFSHNFTIFVWSRVVGGLSKGNVSLSTAIVADVLPPEKRGKGMALIGVAFSVGFLVGPMIGVLLLPAAATLDVTAVYRMPATLALGFSLISMVVVLVWFEETLPEKQHSSLQSAITSYKPLLDPFALFNFTALKHSSEKDISTLRKIGGVYFGYLLIFAGLEFTLTFLTHTKFEYSSMQQGRMFFFIGVIMVLVQGGYVRRIKHGQEQKTAVRGIVLLIPAFVIIGVATTQWLLYVGLAMFSFAAGTVVPCLTTLAASYGAVEERGTVLGIFRSQGALARALGPFIASLVYWSTCAACCYTVGGLAMLIPLLYLCKIRLPESHVE